MQHSFRQKYQFKNGYLVRKTSRSRRRLGGFAPAVLEPSDAVEDEWDIASEAREKGLSCSSNAGFGIEMAYDIFGWDDGFTNPRLTSVAATRRSRQPGRWVEPLLEEWKNEEREWRKGATVDFNAGYYALVRAREAAARERDAKDLYLIRQAEIDNEERSAEFKKRKEVWKAEEVERLVKAHKLELARKQREEEEDARAHEHLSKLIASVRARPREPPSPRMPSASEIRQAYFEREEIAEEIRLSIKHWRDSQK